MNPVTNIVIAGLGGQGVVKASDILADVVFRSGFDVKKAEVHGMSQRGGSVSSDVRFGTRVLSPMIPTGEADYLVVLEATQVEATRYLLRPGGVLLRADAVAEGTLPNAKALNVAMLGMLSVFLAIPEATWLAALHASLPEKLHAVNEQSFRIGRSIAKPIKGDTPCMETGTTPTVRCTP